VQRARDLAILPHLALRRRGGNAPAKHVLSQQTLGRGRARDEIDDNSVAWTGSQ
jgi:hypothetical protein